MARRGVTFSLMFLVVVGLAFAGAGCAGRLVPENSALLQISDWKTGTVLVEVPAKVNSRLYFGWIHSLEKIPWNENFYINASYDLVLDTISFPAFGAGIPEDKGTVCYVKDGLIHMEGIDQIFKEIVWLNSHTATRAITLDGAHVASGSELPQHTRLRLVVQER